MFGDLKRFALKVRRGQAEPRERVNSLPLVWELGGARVEKPLSLNNLPFKLVWEFGQGAS